MIAILAVAIADLCATPPQPLPRDPADSRAYAQAGDDAQATGDARIAAIAYRKAISLDVENVHARQALRSLCRADPGTSDAALLGAIALYRRGELDAAASALDLLEGGGAHLFRGLIALRRHDHARAVRELDLARQDPLYAELATSMRRLARRDGRVAFVAVATPEIDTNPQLVPDTPPPGSANAPPRSDESLLVVGAVTARPTRWLAIRDTLVWRDQRQLSELDFLDNNVKASLEVDRGADQIGVHADGGYATLGGAPYLVTARGTVAYRRTFENLTVGSSYALRRRVFEQKAQKAFTGWVHAGDVGAEIRVASRVDLDVRAMGWREQTKDPEFSDVAGGVQAALRLRIGSRLRIATSATVSYARYDAANRDGTLRRDTHAEGNLEVELDLSDHLMAVGGSGVARNESTIDDFRYWKLTARVGIALAFGGL